jgi:hypothetical protein
LATHSVDECGRRCVSCCWGQLQLVHVAAELLYERCLNLWGGWHHELTGNPQGLAIHKLCCGQLQVLLVGGAYAEEDLWQGLGPLLVCMAHDAVQAFHDAIGCGVVGGSSCRGGYHTSLPGCEKLGFELASLLGRDCLWTTKA